AVDKAKYFKYKGQDRADKNKICLMDQVLEWDDFEDALRLSKELGQLVLHQKEPKSTLEKIRATAKGYQRLLDDAKRGKITRPSVSRLFYFIRNSPNQAKIAELIINPFAQELIGAFTGNLQGNPLKYPLAARLAEFRTRLAE
ncbi:MAG: hypothetical protein AAGJ18_25435, partial [Bacteroidota bacterium]